MELRDYLHILRRRWLSLVIVSLATLALAAGITLSLTPKYTGTTRMFFAVQGGETVTDLAQGSTFTEKQMSSYAEVATSPLVLDRVINRLDLATTSKELAKSVTATVPVGTVILEVSATDRSPERSAKIANAIADQITKVASDLSPARKDGSEAVRATILAKAQTPDAPSSPRVLRNLALGLALGLLLGLGIAVLKHVLDTLVRTEDDVRAVTDHAVLGVIPFDTDAPTHPVVMHDDPLGARSEAVRRLRTNLQFVEVADESKSILVSSSIPGEGKTTTALNLAVSLADAGMRVILVDADLRRPTMADNLGLEGRVGLTTVLIGRADLDDVIQRWQESTLDILPAGQVPPNPSELLGSKAMSSLLKRLNDTYDMVIVDSAPLLPVTDAAILSRVVGGTLVVVGADHTHRAQLQEALDSLETVGGKVIGIVVNKIARRDTNAYVYYSSYTAKDEATDTAPDKAPPHASESPDDSNTIRVPQNERIG